METKPWDCGPWQHPTPTQGQIHQIQLFRRDLGAEFHPGLAPTAGEVVAVPHRTFDALYGTDLGTQLRQRDVNHLIICGLTTNTCVDSTGRDAVEQSFDVTFVSDAVATFTMDMQRRARNRRAFSPRRRGLVCWPWCSAFCSVTVWNRGQGRRTMR